MNEPIVEVQNLTKRYQSVTAVNNVSFRIYPGEVFGLLGPNGAGKTTTLECIEGLHRPTSGTILNDGLHPIKDRRLVRRVLGVQLQTAALPEVMLVKEAMALICAAHDVQPAKICCTALGWMTEDEAVWHLVHWAEAKITVGLGP